jgi:hypothetical protein
MRSRWCLLLALSGCLFPPHGYEGLACDDARPCPDGLHCVAQLCGGPVVEAALNGDFEDGGGGWYPTSSNSALEVQSATVRTGRSALRVFTATPGSTLGAALSRDVIGGVDGGQTWCFEAWVEPGSSTTAISFIARRYGADPSRWEDMGGTRATAGGGWQKVKASITTVAGMDRSVNCRFSGDADADAGYFVDDVRAFVAPLGVCP